MVGVQEVDFLATTPYYVYHTLSYPTRYIMYFELLVSLCTRAYTYLLPAGQLILPRAVGAEGSFQ